MRRNARSQHYNDDYTVSNSYQPLLFSASSATDDFLYMERLSKRSGNQASGNAHRFENTIEAKVEPGDTLQAIALRFHCTVADIKRLNKIDKDNEIHARKIVKIPVTVHNVLLDNLPTVHKSGNNSPKTNQKSEDGGSPDSNGGINSIVRNPLEDAQAMLSEKLMVASVNSSGGNGSSTASGALGTVDTQINDIIMNSKAKSGGVNIYTDDEPTSSDLNDVSAPLITDILDDSTNVPKMHRIRGPSMRVIDWSGSDCDMSWVCLFVVILALCFVIPLVYVFYVAEHSHHNTTGETTAKVSIHH